MADISYFTDYRLPWCKSPFQLLISLLKPGIYLYKSMLQSHGFFVSMETGKITFTLFFINHSYFNRHFSTVIKETQKGISSLIPFLNAFLDEFTFYDKNLISVYKTLLNGNIIVNHSNNTFLHEDWGLFESHYGDNDNRRFDISVDEHRNMNILDLEFGGSTYEPNSLESYLLDGNTLKPNKRAYILEIQANGKKFITIKKKTSAYYWNLYSNLFTPKMREFLEV